ncbi:hypothetical protein CDL15_Pgr001713 [Punica granatum]|uniref:Uncharacterized protein n=1 Tax=Punica granatum TaxID=22663 RepID=A0A218XBS1_PUNGR|nr:hypothetical protein CDL15_Pgr001713 [Punica granatum]
MAHALTRTIDSRGTWYPPIWQSSDARWGTNNGAAGFSRRVSEMMFWRQCRCGISSSSIRRSWPIRASISILAMSKMLGWFTK